MVRPPRFTEQQQAILGADHCSVAVSAGAGCGKTFVLTQRFIGYLRKNIGSSDPLGSIVAITFTDRAAREMRHRVRVACEAELQNCTPTEVPNWLSILRALDGARISTIHAFCSNLLRRFAVEAGLDPTFTQLDVSFGDIPIRRAVRRAFCRLLESDDPDAAELVIRFGFERGESLIRELLNGSQVVNSSMYDDMAPDELVQLWQKYWREECLPGLIRDFQLSEGVRKIRLLLEEHEPSHAAMRSRRGILLEKLGEDQAFFDLASLKTIREAAQVQGGGGKSAWPDETIYEDVRDSLKSLRDQIDELAQRITIAGSDGTSAAAIALTAHRVTRAAGEEYRRHKQNDATLDFDDLLCMARDLLRDHPSVRHRAVAGIKLLMVDEFQDTDPVQAELVRYLCGDQLAQGRLFLVGDAKQSIYRFRRADPRVFSELRNELPQAGRLPLTTNFRSQPAILRFVNYTFSPEIPDYEPLVPVDPRQLSPEPSVEFLFSSTESKDENAEARRRQEACWMARRLKALLESDVPRVRDLESGELRPVRLGDVAILFRTLGNVHLYEQALQQQGLDYYLAGGRAFFAQQEIHDVANLCRWLEDPSDELSLAGALRSPLFGLNDDTLLLLKSDRHARFIDSFHRPPKMAEAQAEQVRRTVRILDELLARKDFLSIADLLRLAIERTGYDAALLCEHLGQRKLANLRKLVGLARSLEQAGSSSLGDFIFRLNQAVREEADEELAATHPEVADVLRLMTIHQAKGLEFPVVILADMDWRRRGGEGKAVYHRTLGPLFSIPDEADGKLPHLGSLLHKWEQSREEDAEQTRLFYVAATRARDHLILSAGLEHDAKPRSPWMRLLSRRFDLLTGLPCLDPYFGSADGGARTHAELPSVLVHRKEPEVRAAKGNGRDRRIPLRQFRELIAQAPARELPPLMRRIEADRSLRTEFSVSEICRINDALNTGRRGLQEAAASSEIPLGEGPFFVEHLTIAERADNSRLIGIVTHSVLEQIELRGLEDSSDHKVLQMAERVVTSFLGKDDPAVARIAANHVHQFLTSPLLRELQSARQIYRELPFRMNWSHPEVEAPLAIIGTIDCLFEDAQGWHLLDYKTTDGTTTDAAGADQAESPELHRFQIRIYGLAVEKVLGVPPRSMRVVRLTSPLSVDSVEVTGDSFGETSKRIDAALASFRGLCTAPGV